MNKGAQIPSVDLYGLHLVRRVAHYRSVTKAAHEIGISQSALSRQIKRVEEVLGIALFERTTRVVTVTVAGAILLRDTAAIPTILGAAIRRVQEECIEVPQTIRVALSNELSLAHLPGIFHAHARLSPEVVVTVSQFEEADLLEQVGGGFCDVGIATKPTVLPGNLAVTHRMNDDFILLTRKGEITPRGLSQWRSWAACQSWVLPVGCWESRRLIGLWAQEMKWQMESAMELESYDFMIECVALGMGCAIIPRRALSCFSRKKLVKKIALPKRLKRELAVVVPSQINVSEHVERFVRGILFS